MLLLQDCNYCVTVPSLAWIPSCPFKGRCLFRLLCAGLPLALCESHCAPLHGMLIPTPRPFIIRRLYSCLFFYRFITRRFRFTTPGGHTCVGSIFSRIFTIIFVFRFNFRDRKLNNNIFLLSLKFCKLTTMMIITITLVEQLESLKIMYFLIQYYFILEKSIWNKRFAHFYCKIKSKHFISIS